MLQSDLSGVDLGVRLEEILLEEHQKLETNS